MSYGATRLLAVVSIALILDPAPVGAQREERSSTVDIGANIHVSQDAPDVPFVEGHVVASPTDPNHLVAVAIAGGFEGYGLFVSRNRGESWQRVRSANLDGIKGFGDPWLAFGAQGEVYLAALDDSSNALVSSSRDGGTTWSRPSRVPGTAFDHTTIVVDRSEGPSSGNVYVLASGTRRSEDGHRILPVHLARSSNQGRDFTAPTRVLPTNVRHQAGMPAVLRDGTIAFSYMDFSEPYGAMLLRTRRVWVVRSHDQGQTFDLPSLVAEVSDFWTFPTLAVDGSASSRFRDRMYVAAPSGRLSQDIPDMQRDLVADMPTGVFIRYSDDQGKTWSRPSVVTDATLDARQVTLTSNRQGAAVVAWLQESRAQPGCFEPFVAASVDGGVTFGEARRVADASECRKPQVPGNVHNGFNMAGRWPTGGDYMGIAADASGVFHLLWSDSRTGRFQLWTASIRVE